MRAELEDLEVGELWSLYTEIRDRLAVKLEAERRVIEERLATLTTERSTADLQSEGSQNLAKYRNPVDPNATWSGRGRRPRWFDEYLKSGGAADDLSIRESTPADPPPARA